MPRKIGNKNLTFEVKRKIIELYKQNKTVNEISMILNIDKTTVYSCLKKYSLTPITFKNRELWCFEKIKQIILNRQVDDLSKDQLASIVKIQYAIQDFWEASVNLLKQKQNEQ